MIFSEKSEVLRLKDFFKQEKKFGFGYVYTPNNISVEKWYNEFKEKIFHALENKSYFPVFRLSDGEFTFVLGRKFDKKNFVSHILASIKHQSTFYSGQKWYTETYNCYKLPRLRKKFAMQLNKNGNS